MTPPSIYLLAGGVAQVIFVGAVSITAGIVVLAWLFGSIVTLAVVAGIWLAVIGGCEIVSIFRIRKARNTFHSASHATSSAIPSAPLNRAHQGANAMNASVYQDVAAASRTHTLFGQVMGYVAATTALFALGAYLGRNLGYGWAFVFYLLALACVLGMRFAVRRSSRVSVALLFGMGLCLGLAISPTLVYYASADPQVLWQAGGATALFIAGCGAAGYATRTDLSGIGRACYWALLGLIIFGIVLIFAEIPGGALIYSILGLLIFAGLTMFDFQRLRRSTDLDSASMIAASIFLDALNVFELFLQLFARNRD